MAEFKQKYQQWLNNLSQALQRAEQQQVDNILQLSDTLKAYLKAGKELSAYESQLFLETFKRQSAEADETPSFWPEALWQEISSITDRTQVEWSELLEDFKHKGVYYQGEIVGMGRYCCQQCQHTIDYTHPSELLACSHCGGVQFFRDGLPV